MGVTPAATPYEAWEYNRSEWMQVFFDEKYYPGMYLRRMGLPDFSLDNQPEVLDNIAGKIHKQVVGLYDWIVTSMLIAGEMPFTEGISIIFSEAVKYLIAEQMAQALDVQSFWEDRKGIAAHITSAATFGSDDDDEDGPQQVDNPFKKGT